MQFVDRIIGICATAVHTYITWVDFPMAMSESQSAVTHISFLPC